MKEKAPKVVGIDGKPISKPENSVYCDVHKGVLPNGVMFIEIESGPDNKHMKMGIVCAGCIANITRTGIGLSRQDPEFAKLCGIQASPIIKPPTIVRPS